MSDARPSAPGAGIGFMCAGVLCMVGLDVTAKLLLETYQLDQLVVLRCLFSVLVIGWYALARGGGWRVLATRRPGWHLARSLLMAGSMYAFFFALPQIPLAMILTIAFAAPLIVTALSYPVLGEAVGRWRWAAVLAGFAGVLVVLQPGAGFGEPAALVALAGATLYALLSLTSRKLSLTESTMALSLYLFPAPMLIAATRAGAHWLPPAPLHWLMFAACGAFGGFAFVFMNAAYRRAPAALLVPFEYTGLVWAAGAGYLLWAEVPAPSTWLGAAIIVTSGLFILYRETVVRRAEPQADFPLQESVVPRAERPAGGSPR